MYNNIVGRDAHNLVWFIVLVKLRESSKKRVNSEFLRRPDRVFSYASSERGSIMQNPIMFVCQQKQKDIVTSVQ